MTEIETEIPPVIVALSHQEPRDAKKFARLFRSLPPEILGFKIANWHDTDLSLRSSLERQRRFVILDTQLNDGAEEMVKGAHRKLSIKRWHGLGRPILPAAITLSPVKEMARIDQNKKILLEGIFDHTRSLRNPVMTVCHSDQTRVAPTDMQLHLLETSQYFATDNMPFDAFELHADTILSSEFSEAQRLAAEDKKRPPLPLLIASRFSGDIESEIIPKIARVFRRGAVSVYVGRSMLSAADPLDYAHNIISAQTEAINATDERFNNLYPDNRPPYRPVLSD